MKKVYLGVIALGLMLLLLAGALAFSFTLQNLRVNAFSFVQPAAAAVLAAPMTSSDEAAIVSPEPSEVRFEEFQAPTHVCQKDKLQDRATDF